MKSTFSALLIGIFLTSTANAANDPDSIGRTLKLLDYASPVFVGAYRDACPPGTPPDGPCAILTGTMQEKFRIPNVTEINIAAGSRNLIDYTSHARINFAFRNSTTGRQACFLQVYVIVTVESTVLNNPSLINSVTGMPFEGKIEFQFNAIVEQRILDSLDVANVTARPYIGTDAGLINRKLLVQYGLTTAQARQLLNGPMKIRVGLGGVATAVTSVTATLGGRAMSD